MPSAIEQTHNLPPLHPPPKKNIYIRRTEAERPVKFKIKIKQNNLSFF